MLLRYVEIHAQFGRYYRLRIPHFGRDLAYHPQSCDVYFAGDKSNVTRYDNLYELRIYLTLFVNL